MGETWQTRLLSTKSPELMSSKSGQIEILGLLMLHTSTHRFHSIRPDADPGSTHEETSDKLKLRDILPENWPVLFHQVNIMKLKDTHSICSRLKETKETQFSALWDPGLGPGQITCEHELS